MTKKKQRNITRHFKSRDLIVLISIFLVSCNTYNYKLVTILGNSKVQLYPDRMYYKNYKGCNVYKMGTYEHLDSSIIVTKTIINRNEKYYGTLVVRDSIIYDTMKIEGNKIYTSFKK